ncbi:hypothetical protein WR25_14595 [Diploscapter pachys]|uniref:Nematode cuticle collagen N-terminal domain-containing protein n=1 Tax=Diploscapter pachys TaxID=2018661 RepID=A0A2A2LWU6_9BILA|nr:hypothetical protein WR25_14595 [Diploscapter pachys]
MSTKKEGSSIRFAVRSAAHVSLAASACLLLLSIVSILYAVSDIHGFYEEAMSDFHEWKHYADNAWHEMASVTIRVARSSEPRKRYTNFRQRFRDYTDYGSGGSNSGGSGGGGGKILHAYRQFGFLAK